jgi:hypothetical protein
MPLISIVSFPKNSHCIVTCFFYSKILLSFLLIICYLSRSLSYTLPTPMLTRPPILVSPFFETNFVLDFFLLFYLEL